MPVSLRAPAQNDLSLWLSQYHDPLVELHPERWSLSSHPNLTEFVNDPNWMFP